MSLPTTPARSMAHSTLSTPSTARNGASPQELTPRSKVKAMLAAVDDESDVQSPEKLRPTSRKPLSTIPGNIQKIDAGRSIDNEHGIDVDQIEEDEHEESLCLPRGKLAARMNAQNSPHNAMDNNMEITSAAEENEDAYKRIRRQLAKKELEGRQGEPSTSRKTTPEKRMKASTDRTLSESRSPTIHESTLRSHMSSPVKSLRSSPGLFVTPEGSSKKAGASKEMRSLSGSESDLPARLQSNARILKRREREAKQAAEDEKRKEKKVMQRSFETQLAQDASSDSDLHSDSKLAEKSWTQQSRPTRKAGKKALEEMSRETQRMSRNMQLAHQAKTKKKVTKDSLFARFNFRSSSNSNVQVPQNSSSTAASSAPASDLDETRAQESPPTSPAQPDESALPPTSPHGNKQAISAEALAHGANDGEGELPDMLEILSQPIRGLEKGKGKATNAGNVHKTVERKKNLEPAFTVPLLKIRQPKRLKESEDVDLDSDSDLDVLPKQGSLKSKRDVFDRLPTSKVQDGRSLRTLRALAHLDSPNERGKGKKPALSLSDMQTSLQQRARQQAVEERNARIEDLKRKGIIVQTAEERQQDQAEVEDLLEKARRQGEEIMQKEKRAAKKQKIANGEIDDLPDTSDEDEDYQEDEGPDIELSGSDEEEEGEGEGDNDENDGENGAVADEPTDDEDEGGIRVDELDTAQGLIENEASEDGDDEEADDLGDTESDKEDQSEAPILQRSRRNKMILDDEDDDVENQNGIGRATQTIPSPQKLPPEAAIFPLGALTKTDMPMGMTQAFAATMAETQDTRDDDEEQDSLAMLDSMPEPNFPMFDTCDSLQMIGDSQIQQETNGSSKDIVLHFSQSQIRYDALGGTQGQGAATQMSEIPDPTQDVGFALSSPAPERFASEPPSTVDTVLLPGPVGSGSPIQKKRGRLQRRAVVVEVSSDADEPTAPIGGNGDEYTGTANAFDAMKQARKAAKAAAAKEAFDKKKSEAKGMVEEQAQESEDEYAGLGGVSDEDSGEGDEDVDKMMDHGEVDVDEGKLAQLYANKERASDEKAIEKLYRDINSGLLRRKRGAELDLSDSDDDAERRRKRKQREFAKMRKALLADEKVGKIAEDPKKLAFLQSIEDRENDDDLDFLDRPADDSFRMETSTQDDSQSQQPVLPGPATSKRKAPLQESIPDAGNMRPPASARRTAAPKKPATLSEIRESVSFLIEDPGAINIAPEPSSSASEDEHHNQHENPANRNPRRTSANPIIDRLSLKRVESTSTSATSRLAFHDPAANPTIGGFKVPSLLRRATTSQLNANGEDKHGISTATAATERAAGGGEKGDFVRRGGSKRSSVNFASREKEKMGAVQEVERRRREERERMARFRRSGLGRLESGSFDE